MSRIIFNTSRVLNSSKENLKTVGLLGDHRVVDVYTGNLVFELLADDADANLKVLKLGHGLIPQDDFEFPESLKQSLWDWVRRQGLNNVFIRESAMTDLALKIGRVLFDMREAILKGEDQTTSVLRATEVIAAIIETVEKGLRPSAHPEVSTENALAQFTIETIRPESFWGKLKSVNTSSIDQVTTYIVEELKAKRPIMISYLKNLKRIDYQKGTIIGFEKFQLDQTLGDRKDIGGHMAVIESLILDKNGKLKWLLIKESEGPSSYDQGFTHMRADYFFSHTIALFGGRLKPTSR